MGLGRWDTPQKSLKKLFFSGGDSTEDPTAFALGKLSYASLGIWFGFAGVGHNALAVMGWRGSVGFGASGQDRRIPVSLLPLALCLINLVEDDVLPFSGAPDFVNIGD